MKFLGFPHRQQFILMLLGPLLNQTSDPGWQMTSEDIQVLYGYRAAGVMGGVFQVRVRASKLMMALACSKKSMPKMPCKVKP